MHFEELNKIANIPVKMNPSKSSLFEKRMKRKKALKTCGESQDDNQKLSPFTRVHIGEDILVVDEGSLQISRNMKPLSFQNSSLFKKRGIKQDAIPDMFDISSLQPDIIRIQTSGSQAFEDLDDHAPMTIEDESLDIKAEDLEVVGDVLGRGAYGVVQRMTHRPTNIDMAVKRITATDVTYEQKQLRMDIDVARKSYECVHIVHHYGAIYRDGDVWICMEIMDSSLEKFYQTVFGHGETIPEYVLAQVGFSVVSALHFLHKKLKVIHRDVKPTNMLLSRNGAVKVCDFGVSGYLEDSIAKTIGAGCKPYMAPERIDPQGDPSSYNIKSDVWSFGISMVEISTGQYPYSRWTTVFEQLKQVVFGDAPRLPQANFSPELCHFVELCLDKQVNSRVNYPSLLQHPFLQNRDNLGIAPFVTRILDLPQLEEPMQL